MKSLLPLLLLASVLLSGLGASAGPVVKIGSDDVPGARKPVKRAAPAKPSASAKPSAFAAGAAAARAAADATAASATPRFTSDAEDARATTQIRDKMDSFFTTTQNAIAPFDPACFYCKTDAGESTVGPVCAQTYANLYSKPVVDFRVTLGYADRGFEVEDGPSRAAWIDRLLVPCQKDQVGTCGFKRDSDDADLFTKSVDGPDGKSHLVRLRIVSSSAGVDDEKNRGPLKALQDAQTKRAEDNFYGGLSGGADVALYVAHAREGHGTSFSPPLRRKTTMYGGVAYNNYDHSSEERMIREIQSNGQPPKFIGIFACDATKYFSAKVRAASRNKSGVATSSGLIPPEIGMSQAFAALDSILAERCRYEFVSSLRAVRKWDKETAEEPELTGFFGDAVAPAKAVSLPQPGENPITPPQDRSGTSADITSAPLIRPPGSPSKPATAGAPAAPTVHPAGAAPATR